MVGGNEAETVTRDAAQEDDPSVGWRAVGVEDVIDT